VVPYRIQSRSHLTVSSLQWDFLFRRYCSVVASKRGAMVDVLQKAYDTSHAAMSMFRRRLFAMFTILDFFCSVFAREGCTLLSAAIPFVRILV
jgi:hypothetical protein